MPPTVSIFLELLTEPRERFSRRVHPYVLSDNDCHLRAYTEDLAPTLHPAGNIPLAKPTPAGGVPEGSRGVGAQAQTPGNGTPITARILKGCQSASQFFWHALRGAKRLPPIPGGRRYAVTPGYLL